MKSIFDENPRITVITPSYNQGHFIEETICSVVSQNYSNLEYFIIDGGSSDETVEIIKKYESRITYWVSEPDRGQTHAINKGLARATGDIIAYINSDDYYLPGTFHEVARYFQEYPETDLLHGRCQYVDETGKKIGEQFGDIQTFEEVLDLWSIWWKNRQFVQPEVFWSRRIFDRIGFFNESLYYVMDYEYWLRIIQVGGIINQLDQEISCFRFTSNQKSNYSEKVADELLEVVKPFLWDKNSELGYLSRLKLKSKWLYHALFLKTIEQSIKEENSRATRWIKLSKLISEQPLILFSPQIYSRLQTVLKGYL